MENTFESKQLLIKLFGEAISELLETTDIDTKDWVDNWIENRITDETISINGVSIGKSKDLLKKMFSSLPINYSCFAKCRLNNIGCANTTPIFKLLHSHLINFFHQPMLLGKGTFIFLCNAKCFKG